MKYFDGRPGEIVWIFLGSGDTQLARIEACEGGRFKVRGFNSSLKAWYASTKWIKEDDIINNRVTRAENYKRQPITNGNSLPLV